MKKLVYLFSMLLFLLAMATGCSDWGEAPELNILELESANVSFDTYGGSGEIVVKSTTGVTASTAATWCETAVLGNKVTVTVPAWGELMGRATIVTVVSGGKNVQVPVTQSGIELKVESKTIELPNTASDTTLQLSCPILVTAQSSAAWLTANVTDDNVLELQATANNGSFALRTATVTLTGGDLTAAVTVTQKGATAFLTLNDYVGTWTLSHAVGLSETGTKYSKRAIVTDAGGYLAVNLRNGTATNAPSLFTFTMDYDATTGNVNIPWQVMSQSGSNLIVLTTLDTETYIHTDGGMDGTVTGGTPANPVLTFTDDGTGEYSPYLGFIVWRFNATTGTSVGQYTQLGANNSVYTFITMTKQ